MSRWRLSMVTLAVMVVASAQLFAQRPQGSTCYAGFPNGISGTVKVYVSIILQPEAGRKYTYPVSFMQDLTQKFTSVVSQDSASNPGHTQFVFVPLPQSNIQLYMYVYTRGGTLDLADEAWAENIAYGLKVRGALFDSTGAAFTPRDSAGANPEYPAVVDAAHRFFQFIANGWRCGK
jgi:hypothetical protein